MEPVFDRPRMNLSALRRGAVPRNLQDCHVKFLFSLPRNLIDHWLWTKHPTGARALRRWQDNWNVQSDGTVLALPRNLVLKIVVYVTEWWLDEMLKTEPSDFVKNIPQHEILAWYERTHPDRYAINKERGFIDRCKLGPQRKEYKAFIMFLGSLMEEEYKIKLANKQESNE